MKRVSSCFECAMLFVCHKDCSLTRAQGRALAAGCKNPAKGRTTDVVQVVGRPRGMSRKNAVKMLVRGELQWLDSTTVQRA